MSNKNFIADVIPINEQGWLIELFHMAVRKGYRQPDKIIIYVKDRVKQYLEHPNVAPDKAKVLKTFLAALDTPDVSAYAEQVISYEKLSLAEQTKLKAEKQRQHKHNWLAQQQPTLKQLNYLLALGYKGKPPTNKLEVSTLIDQLLSRGNGGRAA